MVADLVKKEGIWTLHSCNINMPAHDTSGAIQELETLIEIYNNANELQFAFEAT